MGQRLELQAILEGLLETRNVHFQPKSNIKLDYSSDLIIYKRDWALTQFATNHPYRYEWRYQITLISTDADTPNKEKLLQLPMCIYDRYYAVDGLNHDVYKLFF